MRLSTQLLKQLLFTALRGVGGCPILLEDELAIWVGLLDARYDVHVQQPSVHLAVYLFVRVDEDDGTLRPIRADHTEDHHLLWMFVDKVVPDPEVNFVLRKVLEVPGSFSGSAEHPREAISRQRKFSPISLFAGPS